MQANLEEVGIQTELQPDRARAVHQAADRRRSSRGSGSRNHAYAQYTPSTLAVSAYPFNADKNASHFVDADYTEHADAAWKLADRHQRRRPARSTTRSTRTCSTTLFLIELGHHLPAW